MRVRLTLLGCVALLLFAALFHGSRVLLRQQAEADALRQQIERLEKQTAAERHAAEMLTGDVAAAEDQLAQLPELTPSGSAKKGGAHESEIDAWLAHTRELKDFFEKHPEQKIPEMRLLTDDDWLRVSRTLVDDNDEKMRIAVANVRNTAKMRAVQVISPAMNKFIKAMGSDTLPTMEALVSYFEHPDDADLLSRYEIVPDATGQKSAKWFLQEKSAIDMENDARYSYYSNGGVASRVGVIAWLPGVQERLDQAYQNYSAAHKGAAAYLQSFEKLLPYFNPPLDPEIADRIVKSEKARKRD